VALSHMHSKPWYFWTFYFSVVVFQYGSLLFYQMACVEWAACLQECIGVWHTFIVFWYGVFFSEIIVRLQILFKLKSYLVTSVTD